MNGWRREIAGESILKALHGEATASVSRDKHQVVLEWREDADEAPGD
jgi:hypothetical protein